MTHATLEPAIKPVGKTALCCSYLRMCDAQSARPVGSDTLAHRFVSPDLAEEFEHFQHETYSLNNLSARHALIDQQLLQILRERPASNIISIGSGLETRAFRLPGGTWYEIDEPALIDFKNRHLPSHECSNPLYRIPCDFDAGGLQAALREVPPNSENVFVIEGVFYYLSTQELEHTLTLMRQHSPYHRLICDLITRQFATRYSGSFNAKIRALGADLKHEADVDLNRYGYQSLYRHSVSLFALKAKRSWLRRLIVRCLSPSLRDGYTVNQYSMLR